MAIYFCRENNSWPKIFIWTQLSFHCHYFRDYFFTKFPIQYFWPLNDAGFLYQDSLALWHPVNKVFQWLYVAALIALAIKFKRTPVEVISVKWDQKVVNSFKSVFKL